MGIFFSSVRLFEDFEKYTAVLGEKKLLLQQKSYWQDVVTKYPSYRDAHFRLGVLAYQEGRRDVALLEAEKAVELDPTFVEARMFLEKIGKK